MQYQNSSDYALDNRKLLKELEDVTHDQLTDNSKNITKAREEFVNYLFRRLLNRAEVPTYSDADDRRKDPVKATISMKDFLGEEGMRLYQQALKEEVDSDAFKDTLRVNSTKYYGGKKWEERPIIIIAGPSGSGKSSVIDKVIKESEKSLKISLEETVNKAIIVDGGIVRKTSQMFNLVKKASFIKGYSGVDNLHAHSKKTLDKVKEEMQEYAFAQPDCGVIIPETFSGWFDPFDEKVRNLIPTARKIPKSKLIFARVMTPDDYSIDSNFQQVVATMGAKRAWKTDGFDDSSLLKDENAPESKEYGGIGFYPGLWGSKYAEAHYNKNVPNGLNIAIINDLILIKRDPPETNNWVPAKQGDVGAELISKAVYDEWKARVTSQSESESSQSFNIENASPLKVERVAPRVLTKGMQQLEPVLMALQKYLKEKFPKVYLAEMESHSADKKALTAKKNLFFSIATLDVTTLVEVEKMTLEVDLAKLSVFTTEETAILKSIKKGLDVVLKERAGILELEKQKTSKDDRFFHSVARLNQSTLTIPPFLKNELNKLNKIKKSILSSTNQDQEKSSLYQRYRLALFQIWRNFSYYFKDQPNIDLDDKKTLKHNLEKILLDDGLLEQKNKQIIPKETILKEIEENSPFSFAYQTLRMQPNQIPEEVYDIIDEEVEDEISEQEKFDAMTAVLAYWYEHKNKIPSLEKYFLLNSALKLKLKDGVSALLEANKTYLTNKNELNSRPTSLDNFLRFFEVKNTLEAQHKIKEIRNTAWETLLCQVRKVGGDDRRLALINWALTLKVFNEPRISNRKKDTSTLRKIKELKNIIEAHKKIHETGITIQDKFDIYDDHSGQVRKGV